LLAIFNLKDLGGRFFVQQMKPAVAIKDDEKIRSTWRNPKVAFRSDFNHLTVAQTEIEMLRGWYSIEQKR
jgi:hypothetical protein